MNLAVCMSEAQHKRWPARVADNADDDAVSGSLLLDLDPPTLAGQITTVVGLGNHAFDARHPLEPVLGFRNCPRLRDELQTWFGGLEQRFEADPAFA